MKKATKRTKLKPLGVYHDKNCDNFIKSLKETINDSQNFIELLNDEEKKKSIQNGFITHCINPKKSLSKCLSSIDFFNCEYNNPSIVLMKDASSQLKLPTNSSNKSYINNPIFNNPILRAGRKNFLKEDYSRRDRCDQVYEDYVDKIFGSSYKKEINHVVNCPTGTEYVFKDLRKSLVFMKHFIKETNTFVVKLEDKKKVKSSTLNRLNISEIENLLLQKKIS